MVILMLGGKEPDDDREKHHEKEEEKHPPARVSRVMQALDMNEEIRDIEQRVADEETEAAIYLGIRETEISVMVSENTAVTMPPSTQKVITQSQKGFRRTRPEGCKQRIDMMLFLL